MRNFLLLIVALLVMTGFGCTKAPPPVQPPAAPASQASKAGAEKASKIAFTPPAHGEMIKSRSGAIEFWLPKGHEEMPQGDFSVDDRLSVGRWWVSPDGVTMLLFEEVQLDNPLTVEKLQKIGADEMAEETIGPQTAWTPTKFCDCEALERVKRIDEMGEKSVFREVMFFSGDTLYRLAGSHEGLELTNADANALFASCRRVPGAKDPPLKGRGDIVACPTGDYEVWMPSQAGEGELADFEFNGKTGIVFSTRKIEPPSFSFGELDLGEPATIEIATKIAHEIWISEMGRTNRTVKYGGLPALEQIVARDDSYRCTYFVLVGNRVLMVEWAGKSKEEREAADVKKFFASFRKQGQADAPPASVE